MSKCKRCWQYGLKYVAGCAFLPWKKLNGEYDERWRGNYGRQEIHDPPDKSFLMVWSNYSGEIHWNIIFDLNIIFATKEEAMEYIDKLILSHGGKLLDEKYINFL